MNLTASEPVIPILYGPNGKFSEHNPKNDTDALNYYASILKQSSHRAPLELAFAHYSIGIILQKKKDDKTKRTASMFVYCISILIGSNITCNEYSVNALQHFAKALTVYTRDEFIGMHALLQALTGAMLKEQAILEVQQTVLSRQQIASGSSTSIPVDERTLRGLPLVIRLLSQALERLSEASSTFSEHQRFLCESAAVSAKIGSLYSFHAEALLNRDLQATANAGPRLAAAGQSEVGKGKEKRKYGSFVSTHPTTANKYTEVVNLLQQSTWYFEYALNYASEYRKFISDPDSSENDGAWVPDNNEDNEEEEDDEAEVMPKHLRALFGCDSLCGFEALTTYRLGVAYMSLGSVESSLSQQQNAPDLEASRPKTAIVFDNDAIRDRYKSACEAFSKIIRKQMFPEESIELADVYCEVAAITLRFPGLPTECGLVRSPTAKSSRRGRRSVSQESEVKLSIALRHDELKAIINYMESVMDFESVNENQRLERKIQFVLSKLQAARVSLLSEEDSVVTPARPHDNFAGSSVIGGYEMVEVLQVAINQLNVLKSMSKGVSKSASNLHMYYYCFMKLAELSTQLANINSEETPRARIRCRREAARLLFNALRCRSPADSLELHFIAASQLAHVIGARKPLSTLRCYGRAILCLAAIISRNQYYPDALIHSVTFNPSRVTGLANRRTAAALNLIQSSCSWISLLNTNQSNQSVWKYQFDEVDAVGDNGRENIDEDDPLEKAVTTDSHIGTLAPSSQGFEGLTAAQEHAPRPSSMLAMDIEPESIPIAPPNIPLPDRPPTRQLQGTGAPSAGQMHHVTGRNICDILKSRADAVHAAYFTRSPTICTPAANLSLTLLFRLSRMRLLLSANRLGLSHGHRAQYLRAKLPQQIETDMALVQTSLLEADRGIGLLSFADLQSASQAEADFAFESKRGVFDLMVALEPILSDEIPRRLSGDTFLSAVTLVPSFAALQVDSDPVLKDMRALLGQTKEVVNEGGRKGKGSGPPDDEDDDSKSSDRSSESESDADIDIAARDETFKSLWKQLKSKGEDLIARENQALLILHITEGSQCLFAALVWTEKNEAPPEVPKKVPMSSPDGLKTPVNISHADEDDDSIVQSSTTGDAIIGSKAVVDSSSTKIISRFGKAMESVKKTAGKVQSVVKDTAQNVQYVVNETAQTVQRVVKETAVNVQSAVKVHLPAGLSLDVSRPARLRIETAISEVNLVQVLELLQLYVEALQVRPAQRRMAALNDALKEISDALGISEVLFPVVPSNRSRGSPPVTELMISCPALLRMLPWAALSVVDPAVAAANTRSDFQTERSSHTLLDYFAITLIPDLAMIPVLEAQRKVLEKSAKKNRSIARLCCLEGDRSPAVVQDARVEMQAVVGVWGAIEGSAGGLEHCDVLTGSAVTADKVTTRLMNRESLNFNQSRGYSELDTNEAVQMLRRKSDDSMQNYRDADHDMSDVKSPVVAENSSTAAALKACRVLHVCAATTTHSKAPMKLNKSMSKRGSRPSTSNTIDVKDANLDIKEGDIGLLFPALNDDQSKPPILTAKAIAQQLFIPNCALCILSRPDFGSVFTTGTSTRRALLATADAIWNIIEAFHFAGSCSVLYVLWGAETGGRTGAVAHTLLMIRLYMELKNDVSLDDSNLPAELPNTAASQVGTQSARAEGVDGHREATSGGGDVDGIKEGDKVNYLSSNYEGSEIRERAMVMQVHRDDTQPYYTISLESSSIEKQTDRAHLEVIPLAIDPLSSSTDPSPSRKGTETSVDVLPTSQSGVTAPTTHPPARTFRPVPTATEALARSQRWLRGVTVAEVDSFLSRAPIDAEISSDLRDELLSLAGSARVRRVGNEVDGEALSVNSEKKLFTNALYWGGLAISGEGGSVYTNESEMASWEAHDWSTAHDDMDETKVNGEVVSEPREHTAEVDMYDDAFKQAQAARQKLAASVGGLVEDLKQRSSAVTNDLKKKIHKGIPGATGADSISEDSPVANLRERIKPDAKAHTQDPPTIDGQQPTDAASKAHLSLNEGAGDGQAEKSQKEISSHETENKSFRKGCVLM